MKLTELTESKYAPRHLESMDYIEKGKRIVAYIQKNCAPWIAEAGVKSTVYRGVRTQGKEGALAYLQSVRKARKPKDTDNQRNKLFIQLINDVGGVANRHNSVFGTSKEGVARAYGDVYAMFPVGEFHYTWSPEWLDWTEDLRLPEIEDLYKKNLQGIEKLIKIDTGMPQALRRQAEIMIHCNEVVMIPVSMYVFVIKPLMMGRKNINLPSYFDPFDTSW